MSQHNRIGDCFLGDCVNAGGSKSGRQRHRAGASDEARPTGDTIGKITSRCRKGRTADDFFNGAEPVTQPAVDGSDGQPPVGL